MKATHKRLFYLATRGISYSRGEIENLIEKRLIYKKQRKFQEADNIRTLLSKEGIVLDDINSDSTTKEI